MKSTFSPPQVTWMPLLVGTLLVSHLTPIASAETGQEIRFNRSEFSTTTHSHQTILYGYFLGGEVADIGLVTANGGQRRMRVYQFAAGKWNRERDISLPSDTVFVDTISIGDRDGLLAYRPNALTRIDIQTQARTSLPTSSTSFDPPRKEQIPHVDITHDLNGDGREDIVMPTQEGFQVQLQQPNAAFVPPMTIQGSTDMSRIYGADGYRYNPWSQSRVHTVDLNHDGRQDLAYWSENALHVYSQQADGSFSPTPALTPIAIDIDSASPTFFTEGNLTGRVLHSIADINGDCIGDLVVATLQGTTIKKKRSTYEIHFGARGNQSDTVFNRKPDRVFQSPDSIQIALHRQDFDGDGHPDLVFTTIDREALQGSIWKSLKGFMGDDISLALEFYRQQDGDYARQPDTIRHVAFDGVPSHREPGSVDLDLLLRGPTHEMLRTERRWPKAFNATLQFGDVNGDGRLDLLSSGHPRRLSLYTGAAGRALFAKESQQIRVNMPNDGEFVHVTDLNRDGKQDLVLHQPFPSRDLHGAPLHPLGSEPHEFTVLMTQ